MNTEVYRVVKTACAFLAKGSLNTPLAISEEERAGLCSPDFLQVFNLF